LKYSIFIIDISDLLWYSLVKRTEDVPAMTYPLPATCPVCQNALSVSRLRCTHCGTALEGDFEIDRLTRLNTAQKQFVVSFLRCRGNIREMEKEYAISYPTVRARIDEILLALGESPAPEDAPASPSVAPDTSSRKLSRREILDKLANGEIDAQTAKNLLQISIASKAKHQREEE
jgi:hypothetical protein